MEMEMVFNHMPAEYYADKKISANAKLVLQRLFTLSKDGTQPVYAQRKFLANSLGISMNTITNVFRELLQNNYITEIENTNSFDRTRRFSITLKSCDNEITKVVTSTHKSCDNEVTNIVRGTPKVVRRYHKSCEGGITKVVRSSLDRSKERNKLEEERVTHSLSFDFNSIFSAMNEIKNEFTDYVFSDEEIRENAQSYLDKSQGYKFYKGKPTKAKIKAWLQNSIKHLQEKPQGGNKTSQIVEHGFEIDFEGAAGRLQRFRQLEEQYDRENSEPIEADYQIMDELEDKNTSA